MMNRKLLQIALVLAPAFFAASSFFWLSDGSYGVTSGLLQMLGNVFWLIVFSGLFERIKPLMPRYAAAGLVFAFFGCVCGGAGFALQGIFQEMFHIDHRAMLSAMADYALTSNVIFWVGGPAFPLSLLIMGAVMGYKRIVPVWCGALIALSGVCFPLSRIPRIEFIAHLADGLMLIPMWYLAWWIRDEEV